MNLLRFLLSTKTCKDSKRGSTSRTTCDVEDDIRALLIAALYLHFLNAIAAVAEIGEKRFRQLTSWVHTMGTPGEELV